MDPKENYQNPEIRVFDINNAFKDSEIKGIISTIGGSDSIRLLQNLETEEILKNQNFSWVSQTLLQYSVF